MVRIPIVPALAFLVSVGSPNPASGLPRPPAERGAEAGAPINVKVRHIEALTPISTTAPAPKDALVGEHRLMVVLVQTADAKFRPGHGRSHFYEKFFGTEGDSLASYFDEVSYGQFKLTGSVIGPFVAPGRLSDYTYRQGGGPDRARRLTSMAFATAAGQTDLRPFDRYDRFGRPGADGTVDHFAVVVPAVGEGSDRIYRPIWPHRGTVVTEAGGMDLASYFVFSDEVPLGGMVHEFGHDLGLPDLYDRDDSSHGVGEWCSMGAGSWLEKGNRPAHFSAWGKVRLGWVRPMVMSRSRARVEIPAAGATPFVIKIPIGEIDSPEYFLVENRQPVGFDSALADHGLLVSHIDERQENNDDEGRKLVDVEEPSPTQDLDVMFKRQRPDHQDTFRAGRQVRFDARSNPASLDNTGRDTGIRIRNISRSGAVMVADFEVPTVRDPGGEPHRLMHDNYNYGVFSNVQLEAGGEKLVRFQATAGGYEIRALEGLFMGRPGGTGRLTARVYRDQTGQPGPVLWEADHNLRFGRDTHLWTKVRVEGRKPVRLRSKEKFWIGIEHRGGVGGLGHNPNSKTTKSRFRMSRRSPLRNSFGRGRPVPDFVLRVEGFGFFGTRHRADPRVADETDPRVRLLREADQLLGAGSHPEARARYQEALEGMENDGARYATWIPVAHNALGVTAYLARDYADAADYFERALRRAHHHGDRRAEADILQNLAETHFHNGAPDMTVEYAMRSAALNSTRPDRRLENEFWIARAARVLGNREGAAEHLASAESLIEQAHGNDPAERERWRQRIADERRGGPTDSSESSDLQRRSKPGTAGDSKADDAGSEGRTIDLRRFGLDGLGTVEIND